MTKVKERHSKETYRQCVMHEVKSNAEYVAWLPTKLVRINKIVRIDDVPGLWKIIDAGDPRPAYIVESYAENARKGFPSVTGYHGGETFE